MVKKLEWTKPVLVELGSARRMSFGEIDTEAKGCKVGSGANYCKGGNAALR
ncbi:MAG: hypothetical protein AAB116_01825 [Candidatus Poribacteria bacterium]